MTRRLLISVFIGWGAILSIAVAVSCCYAAMYSDLADRQDHQETILMKQAEILAVNTVLLKAIAQRLGENAAVASESQGFELLE